MRVTRVSDGASVEAMVADSVRLSPSSSSTFRTVLMLTCLVHSVQCPSCVNDASIDMSYAAFTKIATEEEGMVRPASSGLPPLQPSPRAFPSLRYGADKAASLQVAVTWEFI